MPELMDTEVKIAKQENALELGLTELASPSMFACPKCHGVLFEIKDGDAARFRCHTGHAYSPETLLADFSDKNEDTLWSAIRSLEETVILLRDMADHLDRHDQNGAAERLRSKAARTLARADLVREAVARGVEINPDPGADAEVEP